MRGMCPQSQGASSIAMPKATLIVFFAKDSLSLRGRWGRGMYLLCRLQVHLFEPGIQGHGHDLSDGCVYQGGYRRYGCRFFSQHVLLQMEPGLILIE